MNCRHCNAEWESEWEYCPQCQRNFGGAVYPEQQTPEELRDVEALIELIEQAFAAVQLEGGMTIHEAGLEGGNEEVRLKARAKDPESDWQDIPDWKVEYSGGALSFFDPIGWRFYIPAFMRWTLRNWRTTDSITGNAIIWNLCPRFEWDTERYRTLTDEQGKAVLAFLDFFRNYSSEPDAGLAIAAYWHRFGSQVAGVVQCERPELVPASVTISAMAGACATSVSLAMAAQVFANSGLKGITAASTKEDILKVLGPPDDFGGGQPIKSRVIPNWIRYNHPEAVIHFLLDGSRITTVTFMAPDTFDKTSDRTTTP